MHKRTNVGTQPTIELIEIPAEDMLEEDEAKLYHHYIDDIQRECMSLTPDPIPIPK